MGNRVDALEERINQGGNLERKGACMCQMVLEDYMRASKEDRLMLVGKLMAFFECMGQDENGLFLYVCRNCGNSFASQEPIWKEEA